MIGFIKYKLFKWLWRDICNTLDCNNCPMGFDNQFGKCEKCKDCMVDCYDVEALMYKTARTAWKIE